MIEFLLGRQKQRSAICTFLSRASEQIAHCHHRLLELCEVDAARFEVKRRKQAIVVASFLSTATHQVASCWRRLEDLNKADTARFVQETRQKETVSAFLCAAAERSADCLQRLNNLNQEDVERFIDKIQAEALVSFQSLTLGDFSVQSETASSDPDEMAHLGFPRGKEQPRPRKSDAEQHRLSERQQGWREDHHRQTSYENVDFNSDDRINIFSTGDFKPELEPEGYVLVTSPPVVEEDEEEIYDDINSQPAFSARPRALVRIHSKPTSIGEEMAILTGEAVGRGVAKEEEEEEIYANEGMDDEMVEEIYDDATCVGVTGIVEEIYDDATCIGVTGEVEEIYDDAACASVTSNVVKVEEIYDDTAGVGVAKGEELYEDTTGMLYDDLKPVSPKYDHATNFPNTSPPSGPHTTFSSSLKYCRYDPTSSCPHLHPEESASTQHQSAGTHPDDFDPSSYTRRDSELYVNLFELSAAVNRELRTPGQHKNARQEGGMSRKPAGDDSELYVDMVSLSSEPGLDSLTQLLPPTSQQNTAEDIYDDTMVINTPQASSSRVNPKTSQTRTDGALLPQVVPSQQASRHQRVSTGADDAFLPQQAPSQHVSGHQRVSISIQSTGNSPLDSEDYDDSLHQQQQNSLRGRSPSPSLSPPPPRKAHVTRLTSAPADGRAPRHSRTPSAESDVFVSEPEPPDPSSSVHLSPRQSKRRSALKAKSTSSLAENDSPGSQAASGRRTSSPLVQVSPPVPRHRHTQHQKKMLSKQRSEPICTAKQLPPSGIQRMPLPPVPDVDTFQGSDDKTYDYAEAGKIEPLAAAVYEAVPQPYTPPIKRVSPHHAPVKRTGPAPPPSSRERNLTDQEVRAWMMTRPPALPPNTLSRERPPAPLPVMDAAGGNREIEATPFPSRQPVATPSRNVSHGTPLPQTENPPPVPIRSHSRAPPTGNVTSQAARNILSSRILQTGSVTPPSQVMGNSPRAPPLPAGNDTPPSVRARNVTHTTSTVHNATPSTSAPSTSAPSTSAPSTSAARSGNMVPVSTAPPLTTGSAPPPPPIGGSAPPPPPPPPVGGTLKQSHANVGKPLPQYNATPTRPHPTPSTSSRGTGDLLEGIGSVKLRKASERTLPEKATPNKPSGGSLQGNLMAEMQLNKKQRVTKTASVAVTKGSSSSSSSSSPHPQLRPRSSHPVGSSISSDSSPPVPPLRARPPTTAAKQAHPPVGGDSLNSSGGGNVPEWKKELQERKQRNSTTKVRILFAWMSC